METNPFLEVLESAQESLTRRAVLRFAAMGGLTAVLHDRAVAGIPAWIQDANKTGVASKAKRCIVLYLQGGPSHLDTFDPKPGTPNGGEFKAIDTAVSGIQVSEHFPLLAKEMKDVAIIRSMTSREGNHDRGRYLVHTGYAPQAAVQHPGFGSILSHEIGNPNFDLPAFISVGGGPPSGGYFGSQHSPFVVQKASAPLEDVALPQGVSKDRFEERRKLLKDLDTRFERKTGSPAVEPHESIYARAEKLMKSPLLAAFDLNKEDEKSRDAYGKSDFGKGVLLARRLVETGVQCVEVQLGGWDTHQNNFPQVMKLSETLDTAMAQLLKDLRSRGLLKDTVVLCLGEFGRTPRINANGGRDHFPGTWSAVLAGGGIKGGQVIGATTDDGMQVKDNPVTVPDLFFTLSKQFGIDPTQVNFAGPRPIHLVDKVGKPVSGLV
jgi:uncharacterized protein DUF1501